MIAARLRKPGVAASALFVTALLLYVCTASPLSSDSIANAYLPASVLGDGDLAFSPFEAPSMFLWRAGGTDASVDKWSPAAERAYASGRLELNSCKYYLVPTRRVRTGSGEPLFVGAFGPWVGLTALPLAAAARVLGADLWETRPMLFGIAKLTAALLIAGSVALVYFAAASLVSVPRACLIAAAYGAGTCVWSISSQELWQQTAEIFFLSLGAFALVRVQSAWWRGMLLGFALSAAAACRPTAATVALLALLWLLAMDRRGAVAFVIAALPLAAGVLAFNLYYFGSPFEFGQLVTGTRVALTKTGSPELWQTPPWLGAAGLLLSPSRGLLVYSPFLIIGFLGAVLAWRDARFRSLRFLSVAVLALWLPAFLWFDWWGGWSYGYRPIVDSTPLLALLCAPALAFVLERRVRLALFAAALVWSVLVQALGAYAYAPWGWNALADVDRPENRHRLWSFSDWQIGYLVVNLSKAHSERMRYVMY